jgi:hypothetical protein
MVFQLVPQKLQVLILLLPQPEVLQASLLTSLVNQFQYQIMTIRPRLADIWLTIYLVMNIESQGVKNSGFFYYKDILVTLDIKT